MPIAQYGTTNYRGLDPTNIESVLAPLAVAGNKSEAQSLLNYYQTQRDTAGGAYSADLAQQHQAYYDNLANQMAQAQMKAIPEFLKSGGAAYLGPGGLPGMNLATDPNVTQSVIDQANAAEQAKTFQASMTGLNQGSQGGYQVANPSAAPGVPPGTAMTNLGPALAQAAKIRGQYGLAEAGVRAAASNNSGLRATTDTPPIPGSGLGMVHLSGAKNMSADQLAAEAQRLGYTRPNALPNLPPGPGSAAPPPPTGPGGLPVAQTDTPANAPPPAAGGLPSYATNPAGFMAHAAVQLDAALRQTQITPTNKGAIADVQAGYVNGKPNVQVANGQIVMKGKSGATYGAKDLQ